MRGFKVAAYEFRDDPKPGGRRPAPTLRCRWVCELLEFSRRDDQLVS